ncbi:MAG: LysM peptidoglycan-binding domain-containing protein [Myxococcota bacterium]|nr:LysM peptidoglycan-binding domain-containing protein [Myxococcota bacterium]
MKGRYRACAWLVMLGTGSVAAAQSRRSVESADAWIDLDEPRESSSDREPAGAATIDEGRVTGQGIRIGGGVVPPRAVPDVHTVRPGDTLWDITGMYFGDPWQWPRLWSYNPEITNPHWIYPLDRVRLRPAGETQAAATTAPASSTPPSRAPRWVPAPGAGVVYLRDQGYLDAEALRTSGVIVGAPEEQMLLGPSDEVYVRLERDARAAPGMELTVFRAMQPEEREPEEQGTLVRIFGTIRLTGHDPRRRWWRAVITEALDPIERNFRVAAIERRFELVPPVPNERELRGRVVASLRPLRMAGDHQVVFVNLGSNHGVRPGNRMFVVRRGDPWRQSLESDEERFGATVPTQEQPPQEDYPEEVIAEARVVSVRPRSAGLVVTRSTYEVVVGDAVRARRGY